MNRTDVDRAIAEIGRGHETVAAALYRIDAHESRGYLAGAAVTGATAALWQVAQPRIDPLWQSFVGLGEVLERLRQVRGGRQRPPSATLTELTRLLTAPVPGVDVPPHAFALALAESCLEVIAVLDRVGEARAAVATRAAELESGLDVVTTAETALSTGRASTAARLGATLRQLHHAALGDPVGAEPHSGEWARLGTAIAAAVGRFEELARVRAMLPERLAALDGAVEVLVRAQGRERSAYDRAVEKIVDPGLPEPVDLATEIRRAAEALGRTVPPRAEGWAGLMARLDALDGETAAGLVAAEARAATAEGLVGRRDELRGRLLAYQAKAGRVGRAEDLRLAALHRTARDLLWSAPCDLRAATRAVYAYQQELTGDVEGSAG
ncbi:hypothetical protein ACI2K4_04330 [Micromonospora sp. NPDC050397]|uniref:hypothetical protein n=1 Tax=Micromonospora sp. NPDC050397 TaxID=3364279 RepID=UPI00384B2FEC